MSVCDKGDVNHMVDCRTGQLLLMRQRADLRSERRIEDMSFAEIRKICLEIQQERKNIAESMVKVNLHNMR